MCECLDYEDGTRHTCEACVDDLDAVRRVLQNTLAENERLRRELQGVADHLLSMSGGAHNCAGCGFLHKQIVRALAPAPAAPEEEKEENRD